MPATDSDVHRCTCQRDNAAYHSACRWALRIFVSSVSREFDAERRALEGAIRKLGEIYDGMEYFGSDPRSPVAFDTAEIDRSDVYVGLFGNAFGSIELISGKSFTELEYDAARRKPIPTLVYFKNAFVTGAEEPLQARFKMRVRLDQLGAVFRDPHDLETQFLVDLFKQMRGPLFPKLRSQLGQIPADALHAVTKTLILEQIAVVGHDKYIPEIYVPRPAEDTIAEFVAFERLFQARAADIIDTLDRVARQRDLMMRAERSISDAREAVTQGDHPERLQQAMAELKKAFFFREVDEALNNLEHILANAADRNVRNVAGQFLAKLRAAPYVYGAEPETRGENYNKYPRTGFLVGTAA